MVGEAWQRGLNARQLEVDGLRDEIKRLKSGNGATVSLASLFDAERERDELRAENERLRINLRDYRQKHPCHHEVMCWADEIASKALARDKEC